MAYKAILLHCSNDFYISFNEYIYMSTIFTNDILLKFQFKENFCLISTSKCKHDKFYTFFFREVSGILPMLVIMLINFLQISYIDYFKHQSILKQ